MRTFIIVLVSLLLLVMGMVAQDKKTEPWDVKAEIKYKKRLAEVKEEIWSREHAGFNNRNVPAEHAGESAVILAKRQELTTPDKDRELHQTTRTLVKINDKAALEEYSQFSFNQYELYATGGFNMLDPFSKTTAVTYVGVKVYKQDGSVKEIYSDEAVVTDVDRWKRKQRKLAIPGLQVGDCIDYFIRTERFINHQNAYTEEVFVLGDEHPILEYAIHVAAWEEVFALEYRAMNGAPDFKQKVGGRMMELDMLVRNVPAQPLNLWMNPFRQIPLVRLHLRIGGRREGLGRRKEGTVYSNPNAVKIRDESVAQLVAMRDLTSRQTLPFLGEVWEHVKRFKREHRNATDEELAAHIYYLVRYMGLYRVKPGDEIVVDQRRNYAGLSEHNFLRYVNYMLVKNDIEADYVLVTPRYGPAQNEVFETDDYRLMLKTRGKKPVYMSAEGIFSSSHYVPGAFEGQRAPLVPGGPKGSAISGQVEVPESAAADNRQVEHLQLSFGETDMQQLNIGRTTTVTGHFKKAQQQQLLLFEDYYEAERRALGIPQSFMEEFADSRRNKILAEEYQHAFNKAREERREYFLSEIKDQFERSPEALETFDIVKMGLRHSTPEMVYTTRFSMSGYVKKAGNNYILEAGRLIGPQITIKPSQRERKADVYMPFARSFEYNMEFAIPAGYTVEGADKLARNIDNECGSFIVTTQSTAGKLVVQVKKVYKNAFAPASKWPLLLQMVDAAEEFQQQKFLLKKA